MAPAAQKKPNFAVFEGRVVPIEEAKISVMTHALHYGTAVFGGMRGYWNAEEEQLFVFRTPDHHERLTQSAGLLRMTMPFSLDEFTALLLEMLRHENFRENCYIRPLVYKSQELIGVRLHDVAESFTMFALPFGDYLKPEGVHVGFSAWRRVDDNAIPARGKVAGSYANSALIKTDSVMAGYDEALVLNDDGHVSEASAANMFIVRKGVAITPPVTANVLEGITRRTVMHMLREDLGVEVLEREIDRTEVYLADEVFLCGTGVQIVGVTRVEHRPVGSGVQGPVTTALHDLYFDTVTGRVPRYRHWLTPVYVTEGVTAR